MKLIIAGSRKLDLDIQVLHKHIMDLFGFECLASLEIVSGGASGVDATAKAFAKRFNLPHHEFPADWDKYGKSAGPMRNQEMANFGDCLMAFPLLGLDNKGTWNMVSAARNRDLPVYVFTIQDDSRKEYNYSTDSWVWKKL